MAWARCGPGSHTGAYVDLQAQLNRYESDLHSPLLDRPVRNHDGRGRAFSLEGGQSMELNGDRSMTRQAQLSYSSVRFDRFVDTVDAVASTDDADSLVSRVGVAINRDYAAQHRRSLGGFCPEGI
jgi:outer membrane autotransporter protein